MMGDARLYVSTAPLTMVGQGVFSFSRFRSIYRGRTDEKRGMFLHHAYVDAGKRNK